MGSPYDKSREDYDRQVACNECGSTTGEFYRDTDDNDIICIDCLMGLPGEEEKEYRDALDHSNNYEEHVTSTGRVTIRCVFCLEEVATLTWDDIYEGSSDLDDVVALLEKDEPHDCETDEEEDDEEGGNDDPKVIYNGIEYSVMQDDIERDGEQMVVIGIPPIFPHTLYSSIATVRAKDCEWSVKEGGDEGAI